MAMTRAHVRWIGLILASVMLASCGTQEGPGTAGLIFERLKGAPEPSRFSPSRAELAAAGVNQPLLRVVTQVPVTQSAGYILRGQANGAQFYGANDGSELQVRAGLIQSTVGFVGDLDGTNITAPARAIATGQGRYSRVLRHRRSEGKLFETQINCTVTRVGAEQVVILGRSHNTTRVAESCRAANEDPAGRTLAFENTFWLENGAVRASEQWVSYETGTLRLEQVLP
ncbi:MAG: YjbF family lipoprotein [Rhodobacteraceae bacterium]|nr:YjbF family lipoprotein [Paracoccaceae bacterium]